VQFSSSADEAERFDCRIEVLALGRRTSQVRITGSVEERLVFSALGATGEAKPGPVEAQFGQMPDVAPPEDCPRWLPRVFVDLPDWRRGWLAMTDARQADTAGSMWMRAIDLPLTRPVLGFLADIVPSGVVRAAGRSGAGRSLDNCVRFGPEPEGEWVLVDIDPHLLSRGYVHGGARLWSSRGTLLGVASQTATLMLFD
jgi:acyl-CoA thioesterase